jgi:hypothetical protein
MGLSILDQNLAGCLGDRFLIDPIGGVEAG